MESQDGEKGKKAPRNRNRNRKGQSAKPEASSNPSVVPVTTSAVGGDPDDSNPISGEALAHNLSQLDVRPSTSRTVEQKDKKRKKEPKGPKGPKGPQSDADLEAEKKKEERRKRARGTADDALDELAKAGFFDKTKTNDYKLCLRPEFKSGKSGDKVTVLTNFFRVKLSGCKVHKYDVTFEGSPGEKEVEIGRQFKRLTRRLNQNLLATFVQTSGQDVFGDRSYAYDNDHILITNRPLPGIPREGQSFLFQFAEDCSPMTVRVTLKPTVDLNLEFTEATSTNKNYIGLNRAVLQVIDIISKSHAFKHEIVYGSKIFYSNITRDRIPLNLPRKQTPFEIAMGYSQSTRSCQGGLMQNIDRVTAVLFKGGPLIDAMCELLEVSRSQLRVNQNNLSRLEDLTHIRVRTNYRRYPTNRMIRSFSSQPCNQITFHSPKGRVNVPDYFLETYGIKLEYPHLPCVCYGQECYVPVELCEIIPHQRYQRKLREELIRVVSQITTSQKPKDRLQKIGQTAIEVARHLEGSGFEIQLNTKQVTVDSRVLKPPYLSYQNDPGLIPILGQWNLIRKDKKQLKLLVTRKLATWALISLESRVINPNVASTFVEYLQGTGRALGIEISRLAFPYRWNVQRDELKSIFTECKEKHVQLVMVILSKEPQSGIHDNVDLYDLVKYTGDQCFGIPTQVVLDSHYDRTAKTKQKLFSESYLSNLLLKINTKLGGTNMKLGDSSKIKILGERTMVVGVDVNHPGSGETGCGSIAAVVGSIDKDFMSYWTEIQINPEREELVSIDQMIKPIMNRFGNVRGFYPNHIIVYRDGVSEGQFAHVMDSEILPLHKVLQTCPTKPKLTYLVVQKRHRARFFPMPGSKATKSENIVPGSVIDTDVVHYKWFEFYLCSQNALLGTACPAKYTVLWSGNGNTADEIQLATYYLCHLFARATSSIADPAPTRYAHHAAARGKIHLRERMKVNNWTLEQLQAEIGTALNVTDNLKQILYFI